MYRNEHEYRFYASEPGRTYYRFGGPFKPTKPRGLLARLWAWLT